jgi:DNA N-6-adenine-methyltransferase Dam
VEEDLNEEFILTSPEPREDWQSVHFSNETEHWAMPEALYKKLDAEFNFSLDPCPLNGVDGLSRSWAKERIFCNPPYGPGIERWLEKSIEAEIAVYLLPARTDTASWHGWAKKAEDVRFLRGRLKFGGSETNAPFPSVLLIFRRKN